MGRTVTFTNPKDVRAIAEAFRDRDRKPTMRAIKNKVLVRRDAPIVQTEGGIFIPPQSRIVPWTGEVISVGEEVEGLEVGEHVLLAQFMGEFIRDDEMLVCIDRGEILAVVDKGVKIDPVQFSGVGPGMFEGPGQIDARQLGLGS